MRRYERNRGGTNSLPNRALKSLSSNAISLYLIMRRLSYQKLRGDEYRGYILPSSKSELADYMGWSRWRINNSLNELEDKYIIHIDVRGNQTIYLFRPSSEWVL